MTATQTKDVTPPPTRFASSPALRSWFGRLPWWGRGLAILVLLAAGYLLPWLGDVPVIGPQIITEGVDWPSALFEMSYYALMALGLNVVVGFAGLLDLGYVGFFAVGCYGVALLTSRDSHTGLHWSWIEALPIALAAALFSGLILGWPTLRLRGDYLAIVTLGFAEIIKDIATNSTNTWPYLHGDQGLTQVPHPPGSRGDGQPLFGILDIRPYFWLGLTLIILAVLAIRNLDRSRVGRSWLALREDEEAAALMGVRTVKYKLWAFAIGAFVGGVGGALFVGKQGFINSSTFELQFSILILAGVVMGGSGNIGGAILGGALISYIPNRLRGVSIGGVDAFQYRFLIFGLVLVLIMIFRPQGLIASRRRTMELKDRAKEVAPQ